MLAQRQLKAPAQCCWPTPTPVPESAVPQTTLSLDAEPSRHGAAPLPAADPAVAVLPSPCMLGLRQGSAAPREWPCLLLRPHLAPLLSSQLFPLLQGHGGPLVSPLLLPC